MSVLDTALGYLRAGFSIIPIAGDGTKRPNINSWGEYQERRPTEEEVREWFKEDDETTGIAIICGKVSGGLEVIDFDQPGFFDEWQQVVSAMDSNLIQNLPIVQTPKGFGRHVYLRSDYSAPGTHLARIANERNQFSVAIEVRGEKQYVLAPGSPECCHPLKKGYKLISGPFIEEVSHLAHSEREVAFSGGRSLNRYQERAHDGKGRAGASEGRPGDEYTKSDLWEDLLEKHGWECLRVNASKQESSWRRPGKKDPGLSATLGHCNTSDGQRLLYVFSTNAAPFEAESCYNLFAAYTLLEHDGDWGAATKALNENGYGEKPNVPLELISEISNGLIAAKEQGGKLPVSLQKRIDAAIQNSAKFKSVWMMGRDEFGPDQYIYAIFHHLSRIIPDNEEKALVAYHYIHSHKDFFDEKTLSDPEKLARACHYVARASHKVKRTAPKRVEQIVDQAAIEEEAGEASGDDTKVLNQIRTMTMLDGFQRLIQRGLIEAEFSVELDGFSEIRIGTMESLRTLRTFSNKILEVTNILVPRMKQHEWDIVVQLMMEIKTLETFSDEGEVEEVEAILESYLKHVGIQDEEHWKDALIDHQPFHRNGKLYVSVDNLLRFANYRRRREITPQNMRRLLRIVQFSSERLSAWAGGKTVCRGCFSRAIAFDDSDGASSDPNKPTCNDDEGMYKESEGEMALQEPQNGTWS